VCSSDLISFGDPWGIDHEPDGKTLLIVRSEKGAELLKRAQESGIITLEQVTEKQVLKGHRKSIYFKKKTLHVRMKMVKEMGLPLPKHEENLTKSYNMFDALVHGFYLRNNFTMKKKYHKIFMYSKWRIFFERFIVHAIHTLYLKILWSLPSNKTED